MRATDTELAKILWDYNNFETPLQKADIILGLGNNDIRCAKHSAKLFLKGYAPLILFTGSFGMLSKGKFTKSEAETFADEAVRLGVPEDKILIENKAKNTGENILLAKDLLEENNLSPDRFIVVARSHHLRRAYATFMKVWPGKNLMLSAPPLSFHDYMGERGSENFINTLVAVTQRIKIYPKKGFQIKQEIPKEVDRAYQELIERGFTKQLIS